MPPGGPSSTTPQRASAVLLLCLLAGACTKHNGSPTSPPPPGQDIFYTAIGASDAIGIGASIPCFPFAPCPSGTGYVPVIGRALADGRDVTITNLGIPAAVIGPDIQAIGRQYGRDIPANFIEREMPFVPPMTNVLTIFAGANDTNAIGDAVESGAGGSDPQAYIAVQIRAFGADYDTLLRGVRQRAPSTRIVLANLPNLAGVPYAAGYSAVRQRGLQRISVGFSVEVINRLASRGVAVVDLLCDPRSYDPGNYSGDGFHLNDSGYAFLAAEFVEAINTATFPAPRTACPQMTLVPPL